MCFPGRKYPALVSLTMFIFVILLSQCSAVTASTGKYATRLGTRLLTSVVTGYPNASSKIECVLGCGLKSGCKSVSWSESLQQCCLSDRDTTLWWASVDRITADQAWSTYSEIIYPVAQFSGGLGHYTLTFEQARQVCEDHGTELASSSLVLTARSMGMAFCGCGWFADGGNGFILHAQDAACWNTYNTGIIYCSFALANAWCVMH